MQSILSLTQANKKWKKKKIKLTVKSINMSSHLMSTLSAIFFFFLLRLLARGENKGRGKAGQDISTERSKLWTEALCGAPVGRGWRICTTLPGDSPERVSSRSSNWQTSAVTTLGGSPSPRGEPANLLAHLFYFYFRLFTRSARRENGGFVCRSSDVVRRLKAPRFLLNVYLAWT